MATQSTSDGIYETALKQALSGTENSQRYIKARELGLMTMARRIDDVRERIFSNAQSAIYRLEEVTRAIQRGSSVNNPLSGSAFYEMPELIGKYDALWGALVMGLCGISGETADAFAVALKQAFEPAPTYTLDDEPVPGGIEELIANNQDDGSPLLTSDDVAELRAMKCGDTFMFSGGAAAEMVVKRVS